jgi:hypothetical protein
LQNNYNSKRFVTIIERPFRICPVISNGSLVLTPANLDDRVPAPNLLMAAGGGITIGDLGHCGKKFQDLLIEEAQMLMLTRADATERKKLLSQIRQQIETTASQLWLKFIDRVLSRSWLGL